MHYPGRFTDERGSESLEFFNDSFTLRMVLRGIEFVGDDFDSLQPTGNITPEQHRRISLHKGNLCSCRIDCEIPIPIVEGGRQFDGVLFVELIFGDPAPNGGLDRSDLRITLAYNGQRIVGPGTSGYFEDELLAIQEQLPNGVFMKACINCLFSDYSPYGHGLFGYMMCFRNLKSEYVKVRSKVEFWAVHHRFERHVQETYLCSDFERRIPGTGYRE